VLAVDALEGVALTHDIPALNGLATSTSNVFEETALVVISKRPTRRWILLRRRSVGATSNPFRSRD